MHNSVAQKSVDDKTMSWQYCRLGDVLTLKGGQDLSKVDRERIKRASRELLTGV